MRAASPRRPSLVGFRLPGLPGGPIERSSRARTPGPRAPVDGALISRVRGAGLGRMEASQPTHSPVLSFSLHT